MREHPTRIAAFQQLRRRQMTVSNDHPALFKGPAAFFQCIGHIGQRLFGMGPQMRRQARRRCIQRGPRFGRNDQRLKRPQTLFGRHPQRSLLQHRMGVRATNAQTVHARPARASRCPFGQPIIHLKRRGCKINRRVGRFVSQTWRQLAMMQRQRHFDQTGHACGRVQMPDIGFHRPDFALPHRVGGVAKRRRQCRHFDGIAQIGAGAVTFDVTYGVGRHPRYCLGLGNAARLTVHRRGQIACLGRAIVVDG